MNKWIFTSIFNSINADNLAFYHKMKVTDDYIKEVIVKVIKEKNEKGS